MKKIALIALAVMAGVGVFSGLPAASSYYSNVTILFLST